MLIKRYHSGPFGVNCYVVTTDEGSFVVDPGGAEILPLLPPDTKAILLTHGHFDHIGGADALRDALHIPLYIHREDAPMLTDAVQNLSAAMGMTRVAVRPADAYLQEGDTFMGFSVLHTPGHSAGSVCLYHEKEKVLFSGDTLFFESYGRYDFGDCRQLMQSLARLFSLPPETQVYPGHDKVTTIDHERKNNPASAYAP